MGISLMTHKIQEANHGQIHHLRYIFILKWTYPLYHYTSLTTKFTETYTIAEDCQTKCCWFNCAQTLQPVHVSTMLQKFLALMLDACEWLLWHPTHFTATDTAPHTHWLWLGVLHVWRGRNKSPYCEMNTVHSACNAANQAVLQLLASQL